MRVSSIRRRLVLAILSGAAVFAVIAGVVVFMVFRHHLEREAAAGLRARCAALSAMLKWEDGHIEDEIDHNALTEFYASGTTAWFRCVTESGQIVVASPGAPPASSTEAASQGRRITTLRFVPSLADDDDRHEQSAPTLLLTMAIDAAHIDRALLTLGLVLMVTALCGLALVPWVAGVAVKRLLAPLDSVSEFAERLRPENPTQRIPLEGVPIELVPVCKRLNLLAERMIEALEKERRFSGDIAHELRTPLAELHALNDVALTWPTAADPPVIHHRKAQASVMRLEAIVNALLSLYRHEHGLAGANREDINLGILMRDTWSLLAASAAEKNLRMTWSDESMLVLSDGNALGMVVRNLLANAVDYTPNGGAITIEMVSASAEIRIVNAVTDVVAADLVHLGERFWRKDRARSGTSHCGLGIALSRAICRSLGLELSYALNASGSLVATVGGFSVEKAEKRHGVS